MQRDVITYAGEINTTGYEAICSVLAKKGSDRALLILATPGGDPHAGFRIARALQHHYENFDVLIPRYCKSAGTLVAVGASTLYMDDMSELGPLDIQVKKNDEIIGRNSGLDILQAVSYLQNQAMSAFRSYLVELTRDAGLSTKVASGIASNLTTGLFEPIFEQIDPTKLAEMQRATEIAFEYGGRLNDKSNNLRPEGLAKLVTAYPSHGFVIDRKEAKTVFVHVEKPVGVLSRLSQLAHEQLGGDTNNPLPVVNLHQVSIDESGELSEIPPDAASGTEGHASSEPAVDGHCQTNSDDANQSAATEPFPAKKRLFSKAG